MILSMRNMLVRSDAAFNYSVELDLSKSELPIEIGYTVTSVTAEKWV